MKKILKSFLNILSPAREENSSDWEHKIDEFQKQISYQFANIEVLRTALTHDSYFHQFLGENSPNFTPAERMEFLGDSVLGLIVAEELFVEYPDQPEGELSKKKSKIVSEKYLAIKARELDLGSYILMTEEEAGAGGRDRKSILSDAMESLICAIYLDGGIIKARKFVKNHVIKYYKQHIGSVALTNYKSILQEHSQSIYHVPPEYKVTKEFGPEHKKTFCVEVIMNGKLLGYGEGNTKKSAQQKAAQKACQKLKI